MSNKAHSTVINRLVERYQGILSDEPPIDILAGELKIAVETTATLPENLPQLLKTEGQVYVAVTNQDGVGEALKLTAGTRLGVMNARGDIERPAGTE